MKNLEQIRARNALARSKKIGKGANGSENVEKKVPAMIRENGFLGAMAFAIEKKKGYTDVFEAIIAHLKETNLLPGNNTDLKSFFNDLSETDCTKLRLVTAEAMAYLNYLRRFVERRDNES